MLNVESLSVAYADKPVLEDVGLKLGKGQNLAVIGPNGSGKSTLALSICGVIPDFVPARVSGEVHAKEAGLIMQTPSSQFFAITVKEELGEKGLALAHEFDLGSLVDRNVFQLSEGEKQKINLLSNLCSNPGLLLLDEPLELLDPVEKSRFKRILFSLNDTAIVWLDKVRPSLPNAKNFFLKKQALPVLPKPKSNASSGTALKADFLIKRNGFSLKANFSLSNHEKLGFIGRNGSGKSLMLKAIAGVEKFSGSVSRNGPVSLAPQNPSHLFFNETAEAELVEKGNASKLGISHLLKESPSALSKGQQKLLSVAATNPGGLALLDEPTTWLDPANKATVYNYVNESRQPMVIATHDRQLLRYCDRVFLIDGGEASECSSTAANRFFRQ